jgi:hypothetical protein
MGDRMGGDKTKDRKEIKRKIGKWKKHVKERKREE